MKTLTPSVFAVLVMTFFLLYGCPGSAQRLLLFTKTNGYRHASIEDGVKAFHGLAKQHSFHIHHTEDSTVFHNDSLSKFDVIVFLNTSGNILGKQGQAALVSYIHNGGGYVGIHAAADTETQWKGYKDIVGAFFTGHPPIQQAKVYGMPNNPHPATRFLPQTWIRTDEWYDFDTLPGPDFNLHLVLDEATYQGAEMHQPAHPVAWSRTLGQGRCFYTALGHTSASYQDALFLRHLATAVKWAARK